MLTRLNAAFLELEKTRDLVDASCSLDELHRVINQLMSEALACSKASTHTTWGAHEAGNDASLDKLIEALANICIALFDCRDIPRERLLLLVDQALHRKMLPPDQTTH